MLRGRVALTVMGGIPGREIGVVTGWEANESSKPENRRCAHSITSILYVGDTVEVDQGQVLERYQQ